MSWQPMETAPKDGRPLLLHNADWHVSVAMGGWDAHEQAWRVHGFGCPASQPTQWHETPPRPDEPRYYITEAGRRMLHEDNGA